jgi:hypothetical protein
VNVKRAVAAAASVLGTLILVVALGAGYFAGHSSARPGATTVSHSAARNAAPVKATLDAMIYGDSTSVPGIYGDGNGVSSGSGSSTTTTTSGNTITVTPTSGTPVTSAAIYGD